MRWFRDAFCAEEKLIAERLGIDTYTLLEEMASRVPPGSWGVMPIFSDRMRFKTWYHAAPSFINLSIDPDKCNKATLFRALEENASIVSACNLQQIADFSNIHPTSLVFAGGGSKGKLWSQILADVSGLPVNIPVVKEATALGCAIAAGVGAGIFHQWQKPENAWFAGNGRTHQTQKSMNFIRIHAISGRQFIRISWGWLIMD